MLALALRTWLRYVVPLTALAAIVMCAVAYVARAVPPPADLVHARVAINVGWGIAGTAWLFQLVLVAAAAPLVASIARDTPLSQLQAIVAGARGLGRGLVPCGVAIAAIALGGVALVVPGVLLLGLLALTGASDRLGDPLPAALADSIAVVRAHVREVALVVAIIVVADLAIALVAHLAILPALPRTKPPLALLAPARTFVRVVAAAVIAGSAVPACVLAAIYQRANASATSRASRA
ncbi:MAG: hypothetical protein ABI467_16855 [Kofleriaceae bacterium]